jgi:Family of unknown function (DUF6510)
VRERRPEIPSACTLVLEVPAWPGHLAGQHIDVLSPRRIATRRHTASRPPPLWGARHPIHLHTGRPEDQPRPPGRISIDDLASQGWPAELQPTLFVYGPTGFVETVSDLSGFLARCPSCESVLLRMVRTFDALWLDMSGLRILMMINSTSESYSL